MVGYIFFLLFGPYQVPMVGTITPTDPVKAGSLARYEAADCKTTSQEATIYRALVSTSHSPEINIAVGTSAIRSFQCSNIILIPLETPSGDYKLVISAQFRVNPLRSIDRQFESLTFHIDNPDPTFVVPPVVVDGSGTAASSPPVAVTPSQATQSIRQPTSSPGPTVTPPPPDNTPPQPPTPSLLDQAAKALLDTTMCLVTLGKKC